MNRSRRCFLTLAFGLATMAGCSGVQRRPAPRINPQASLSNNRSRTAVLGRASEGGVEVVGPEVSSRVDPEPPLE